MKPFMIYLIHVSFFHLGDDLYIIRLLIMIEPSFQKLRKDIALKILLKIVMISRCKTIQNINYTLIEKGFELDEESYLKTIERGNLSCVKYFHTNFFRKITSRYFSSLLII